MPSVSHAVTCCTVSTVEISDNTCIPSTPPPPPLSLSHPSKDLAETDDVVHPLLFAAETKNPRIVQISLTSLQKLMQYKAIPQVPSNLCFLHYYSAYTVVCLIKDTLNEKITSL